MLALRVDTATTCYFLSGFSVPKLETGLLPLLHGHLSHVKAYPFVTKAALSFFLSHFKTLSFGLACFKTNNLLLCGLVCWQLSQPSGIVLWKFEAWLRCSVPFMFWTLNHDWFTCKCNLLFFSLTTTTNSKQACVGIIHEGDVPGEFTVLLHTPRRNLRGMYLYCTTMTDAGIWCCFGICVQYCAIVSWWSVLR